eukprot:63689-Hanusia_phi.AAC.1
MIYPLMLLFLTSCSHARIIKLGSASYTLAEMAQLHMEASVSDLKATDIKVYWGALGESALGTPMISAGSVIEIYLPRFAGGSNLFGARRDSEVETVTMIAEEPVSVSEEFNEPWSSSHKNVYSASIRGKPAIAGCFGITQDLSSNSYNLRQLRFGAFSMCYWDSQREMLRLVVSAEEAEVTGVYISKASLYQNFDVNGEQNGLGPLPPIGGIDEKWYQIASISVYAHATGNDCTSGILSEFPSMLCLQENLVYQVPFDQFRSVRFGTDLSPIPVRKEAGAVGDLAPPSFVYAAASGNHDGPNQDLCITITLVSSATIYSEPNNPTTLYIKGLTGSASESSLVNLYQNKCQCEDPATARKLSPPRFGSAEKVPKVGQATFDTAGTLAIQLIPGFYIQAEEVLTFSFKLKTGTSVQQSRRMTVEMYGAYCQRFDFCKKANDAPLLIPTTTFNPCSKILEVVGNKARMQIFQSTSDPGVSTNVFVTLRPNFQVEAGSVITIQGLCGIDTTSMSSFSDFFVSNRLNGGSSLTDTCTGFPSEIDIGDPRSQALSSSVEWNNAGTLKLTLQQGYSLNPQQTYAFSWSWKNSNTGNAYCDVSVTISRQGSYLVSAELVENVRNTVGYVEAPGFIEYKIGQASTRPDSTNYICVTLKSNFRVQSLQGGQNSYITLHGLSGTQTVEKPRITGCPTFNWDTMRLEVPSSPPSVHFTDLNSEDPLNRVLSWQTTGQVILLVAPDSPTDLHSIERGQEITFAIELKNSKVATPCQKVTMTFNGIGPGNLPTTQIVWMVQTKTGRALEDGEEDGDACVLKTYDFGFHTKVIAQSSSLVQNYNDITVTLRSNMNLLAKSYSPEITISGLTGTSTLDTYLQALPAGSEYFPQLQESVWHASAGTLTVKLKMSEQCEFPRSGMATFCIFAGWNYAWKYRIMNGHHEQSAINITIQSRFALNDQTEPQNMTRPLRLDGQALHLTRNLISRCEIGQLFPAPGAINPVCVTLRPNKDMSLPSQFTLTGLDMFESADVIDLYDEYGIAALNEKSAVHGMFETISVPTAINKVSYLGNQILFRKVQGMTLQQDKEYKVCFMMTNKQDAHKTCPSVYLTLNSDEAPSEFPGAQTVECRQDKTKKIPDYVSATDQPSCAGYISDRSFVSPSVRTSSNVTGNTVWVIVELQPNYPLQMGQEIKVGPFKNMNLPSSATDTACTISRNGQFVKSFQSPCKFLNQELQLTYVESAPSPVYSPYVDAQARRQKGLYKIIVKERGTGYTSPPTVVICDMTPGQEYWTKANCTKNNVTYSLGGNANATAIVSSGGVAGVTLNHAGSGYAIAPKILLIGGGGIGATAEAVLYDYSVYTVQVQLTNSQTRSSASPLTVASTPWFSQVDVKSGMDGSETSLKFESASSIVFTVTPQENLYEGDLLYVNLPHYEVESGPLFGITSSPNPAFTTFSAQLEWELHYGEEDRARAYITNGWVADGNRQRSGDGDVDGLFVISPGDEGYKKNKDLCWSRKSCPWGLPDSDISFGASSYSIRKSFLRCLVAGARTVTPAGSACTSGSPFYHTGTYKLGYTQETCYRIVGEDPNFAASDYVGMQLRCRNNQHVASSGNAIVSSVRVRNGGRYIISGNSGSIAGGNFSYSAPDGGSAAFGTLAYKVVAIEVSAGIPNMTDKIVIDSTFELSAASVYLSSLYGSIAIHVADAGFYAGFPTATVEGRTDVQLKVHLAVATASLSVQGSGYSSIPTVSLGMLEDTQHAILIVEPPILDVSLTLTSQTVVTQSILDYNPAAKCFLVQEEFDPSFLDHCKIIPKENVGRYTGMTAMIGSNEYMMIQGSGGVYWVTDATGNKPRNLDVANKPYTIYTQLQIQVARNTWVRQGESIQISIPGNRFKSIPPDQLAFVTPATVDARKTIKERTSYSFAAPFPHRNVEVKGSPASRMLLFGNLTELRLKGQHCTVFSHNIAEARARDGTSVNGGSDLVSDAMLRFEIQSWGSGFLRPPHFLASCGPSTLNGVFVLQGQRTGVQWIEVVNPGTSCVPGVTVTISSPAGDVIFDGESAEPVCQADESFCKPAIAVVDVVHNRVQVSLRREGSGYLFAPTITFTNPPTSATPCDAVAIAHLYQNYSSRLEVTRDSHLMSYQENRDQFDSLSGLYTSFVSPVSLFSLATARQTQAEIGTGYVADIVLTTSPSEENLVSCNGSGAIVIESPPSGARAMAKVVTTESGRFATVQVTAAGYGYVSTPQVSMPQGCPSAKAILGFKTTDVHVSGGKQYSSHRGFVPAAIKSGHNVLEFASSMDSPVVVGFNQACSKPTTQTFLRRGSAYGNSGVTGVVIPSSASVKRFVYGFTSITFELSPVNGAALIDKHANALGVPTWSFPDQGYRILSASNVLVYRNSVSNVRLADCAGATLIFNHPEVGSNTLKIKITSVTRGSPTYEITQQGKGYANIPSVVDIQFVFMSRNKLYQRDFQDLSTEQQTNCKPSYWSFDTSSNNMLKNIFSQFSQDADGNRAGLTVDGAFITQEGYGYDQAPIATLKCSGCSNPATCTTTSLHAITSPCTASDTSISSTISNLCKGKCENDVASNAFYSMSNLDGLEVCSGSLRSRKTLQMRVSNGASSFATDQSYTVKRHQGFDGRRGSLIFKIAQGDIFTNDTVCKPPRVFVEPPPSGGMQAEVVLEVHDAQYDFYTNQPSASLTASEKGFTVVSGAFQYAIRVVNAGSGYTFNPKVTVITESLRCHYQDLLEIHAYVRDGLSVSHVELVRKYSLPQAGEIVSPICSRNAFLVPSLCLDSDARKTRCESQERYNFLNPGLACNQSSCPSSPCSSFPCAVNECGEGNCASFLKSVTSAIGRVESDDAFGAIGWDATNDIPVVLNGGFGYTALTPNPLRLEFPSDISVDGRQYPCAEINVYFDDAWSNANAGPGPRYWPGDLSITKNDFRNNAAEVTEIHNRFGEQFLNGVFGSFANEIATS